MSTFFTLAVLVLYARVSGLWPALRRKRLRGSSGGSARIGILVAAFPAACIGWGTVAGAYVGGASLSAHIGVRGFVALVEYAVYLFVLPFVSGIHMHNDVIERDNRAAAISLTAAALALAPSVIGLQAHFAAPLSTAPAALWLLSAMTPLLAWLVLELRTKISWAITVDRDTGTALRLSAILLAMSMVPAYAVLSKLLRPDAPLPSPWAALAAPIPVLLLALFFERRASAPAYPPAPLRSLPTCGIYLAGGAIATGAAMTFLQ